uniref:ABC transmembrane type-1 domain-containing protein n=1 Tax=Globodera pallida TaxID=36090 RepID=A0A183BM78_GLOPA
MSMLCFLGFFYGIGNFLSHPMNTFNSSSFCSTAPFPAIPSTNSTFSDVVSPCLANVLLPSIPAAGSILSLVWLIFNANVYLTDANCLPINRLIILKGVLSVLDLFVSFLRIFFVYFVLPLPALDYRSGAIVDLIFSLFAALSYGQCVRVGFITSGFLHIVWFLRFISLLPCHVLFVVGPGLSVSQVPFALLPAFHLGISIALVLLFAKSDYSRPANYQRVVGPTGKEICPEDNASALSAVTYSYATKMFFKGLKGDVTFEDLWELQKERQGEVLRDRFYATDKGGPIKFFSFVWRMFKCTWEWQLTAFTLSLIGVVCLNANAAFLKLIVTLVEEAKPLWLSMVTLCTLFFVDFAGKVLSARRDFNSFMAQTNVRSFICCAVLDKTLKLSSAARQSYSTGEIINLVTTDLQRISYWWHILRDFVECPLMVVVPFFGLWLVIGVSTLYGFTILIMTLPLNYVISKQMNRYETKQMAIKDARLKLVTDVLGGIKVLKLYAWEESMQQRILKLRREEMKNLRMIFLLDAAVTMSFQLSPLIATLASFFAYTILYDNTMRPDVAFVSLLFFGMLRFSISQVPQLLANSIRAMVSVRRVVKFLNEEEQQPSHIIRGCQENGVEGKKTRKDENGSSVSEPVVSLHRCSFTWGSSKKENPILQLSNISLEIEAGKLIGIVGKVGSGKSSLLAAILGEMDRVDEEGSKCVVRASSVGYVPQKPWIQNKTLRGNVLFDAPFNEEKYWQVLDACAMDADLKLLVAGDKTEIGEKGINLSGGQKARVALARAVYMDAELYILDDTLSAVDAHVGAHLFERVISTQRGLLAGKTRLFALNSLSFLKYCDRIVVMDDGKINMVGTLDELKQRAEGPFAELMKEHMEKHFEKQKSRGNSVREDDLPDESADQLEQVLEQLSGSPLSHSLLEFRRRLESSTSVSRSSLRGTSSSPNGTDRKQHSARRQPLSSTSNQQPMTSAAYSHLAGQPPIQDDNLYNLNLSAAELIGRITEEEELCTGMVARRVYLDYAKAFGMWLSIGFILCLFVGCSTFQGLSSVWLAKWSSSNATSKEDSAWNLGIYGGLSSVYVGAYHASMLFHDKLLSSLFHAPMAFFDRTPLGRILNRLSGDIDRIDENIPFAVGYSLAVFAEAFNSLIAICIVIPVLILVVVPLLIIFLCITHFYNVASVQFRRLTSKSRSSLCSFVEDAYSGSDSIRILFAVKRFQKKCCRITDIVNESFAVEIFSNRWLQIRLDIVSDLAVFICVAVAILLASQGVISLGSLALVIACGYQFTGYLGSIARVWRESEVQMVSVERVNQYIRNQREPDWRVLGRDRLEEWPSHGNIRFRDFCLRYREDGALVLNGLNFEVASRERVGIVGRTGAGKSSITMALFRIVEPTSGQILIDGVDITTVGLHDLREALTIIPQDPVLFCGTLRSNLDPFDEYPDSCVWDALEKSQLKETVSGLEGTLQYELAEKGSNLSEGQRQLVCLARALLRQKTRILVLDEATAAVDTKTDSYIQQCIRTHFSHCTVLTIAHRLDTILDYDRVLLMDKGEVAEFDTPSANRGQMSSSSPSEELCAPYNDFYENLFRQLNPSGSAEIDAASIAAFLKTARGVNVAQLSQIWEIASDLSGYKNRSVLNRLGVFMCFKLVAAIQQGFPLAPSVLDVSLSVVPQFECLSLPTPPPQPPAPPPAPTKSPSIASELAGGGVESSWPIGVEEQRKYEAIFDSLGPVGGKLSGDQCKPVLLNSQLPKALLAKIWDLADMDSDGFLDRPEFYVALHLVYKALQNEPILDQLPQALIPPSKRGIVRRMSTRSVDPTTHHSHAPPLSWSSRASSVASLNIQFGPPTSPPTRPPRPASRALSPPPNVVTRQSLFDRNPSNWKIDDLAQYESEFIRLDGDRDGFIGGGDVRDVFLRSGLPQHVLARIWANVDVAKTGKLGLEQYAKCVELIRECQVEQSSATAEYQAQGAASGDGGTPSSPPLLAASSGLARRDSQISNATNNSSTGAKAMTEACQRVMELNAEIEQIQQGRRQAEQDLFQAEADMKVKNSEIRNLEIELLTLNATVKQLMNQRVEANKRLNDLDTKIVRLEGMAVDNQERLEEDEERLAKTKTDIQKAKGNSSAEEELLAQLRIEVQARRELREVTNARLKEQNAKFEGFVDELTQLERGMAKNEEECAHLRADMAEMERILAGVEKGNDAAKKELLERTFFQLNGTDGDRSSSRTDSAEFARHPSSDPFGGENGGDPFGAKLGGGGSGSVGDDGKFANFANFSAFS